MSVNIADMTSFSLDALLWNFNPWSSFDIVLQSSAQSSDSSKKIESDLSIDYVPRSFLGLLAPFIENVRSTTVAKSGRTNQVNANKGFSVAVVVVLTTSEWIATN